MPFLEDAEQLDQIITSLEVRIRTRVAPKAGSDSKVYCNVVFTDGSLLSPRNIRLDTEDHNDFEPGNLDVFPLSVPEGFDKKIGDIADFYIRKDEDKEEGWLLGGATLRANGLLPVLGNNEINEFLDNEAHTLFRRDWSPRSLCVSSCLPPEYPLLCPQYRIAGPVLGQLSATSANILFRVDQEGMYRLRVFPADTGQVVSPDPAPLSPTTTFRVTGLTPNTHYRFQFFRVFDGQDIAMPEGDGEFRTFPAEGSAAKFSVAFGSCSGNKRNVGQTAWTGIRNLAADPAVNPVNQEKNVRLFLHLGDTFYFYDDVTDEEPRELPEVRAAHLSQRRHPRFLDMARAVPCCAVWDDHDFRKNNKDSVDFDGKANALTGFLDYWGNNPLASGFGLTTLITYGNVDIYLMDGRFLRDKDNGVCFTLVQLNRILALISSRGAALDRLVVLASGSTWNHANTDGGDEAYGNSQYALEREFFYGELNRRLGNAIKGLVFLSGDIHRNEIHEVSLPPPPDMPNAPAKVAPEFVSSPMGRSESLHDSPGAITPEGERKVSHPSDGEQARRGFATLEIDTTNSVPDGNWAITVRYHSENASETTPYESQAYVLDGGQFKFLP